MEVVVGGKYFQGRKIGSGSFGQIYEGNHLIILIRKVGYSIDT